MKKYVFFCAFIFNILLSTEINEFSFILKPATIQGAGVGVFAVHDIEVGTFIDVRSDVECRMLHKDEIPSDFLKMCVAVGNGFFKCPLCFSSMEVFWYLNHSDTPNIDMLEEGLVMVNKNIQKGEELFMDYNQLNEPEEDKEGYYR
jgi:hypothetical protein